MRSAAQLSDQHLVQIVDAALAETTRKSGKWLVCRPGCTQCCVGPFAISQLDALRLRQGFAQLESADPARAKRVRERVRQSTARLGAEFPGDPTNGILSDNEDAVEQFFASADNEPCPVLDPASGTCDLYAARPMTCRVFGPPVRSGPEGGLGVCELCFQGATDNEIAACEMDADPEGLEQKLLDELEKTTGASGNTIVAFALKQVFSI